MTEHEIAAHQVAKHLRAIAALLPRLSARGADPLYDMLLEKPVDYTAPDLLEACAARIAATAPFEPLTNEQVVEVMAHVDEQVADMHSCDAFELYTEDWTDADWRNEYDELKEYLND